MIIPPGVPNLLKELNTPFTGGEADKKARLLLRYLKEELKEDRPDYRHVRASVRRFLPALKKTISALPVGSTLIVMPSTTQRNVIPRYLAEEIKKGGRQDLLLVNLKGEDIKVKHRTQSKRKDNYDERIVDPRSFTISEGLVERLNKRTKPAFIIDDSLSTGDSAVTLQRELLKKGVDTRAVVAALVSEPYHVRQSDLDRVQRQLAPNRPLGYSERQLREDLFTVYAGYPRKKITDFQRALSSNSLFTKDPNFAYRYLREKASYLVENKLSPVDVINLKRDIKQQKQLDQDPRPSKGPKL